MTLIVSLTTRNSIWLMADRRLSSSGRVVRDDATKVMCLETADGVAVLGYAGLGATSIGTEPASWMSNVLRGRNLPLEHSLGILAEAAKKALPPHLAKVGRGAPALHHILVPALLGDVPRIYSIDLALRLTG